MITQEERTVLRELAKQVRDLAADDINRERIQRSRDMHSLKPGRPLVWIDEIPWHEMNIGDALTLRTKSKEAQDMETYFRRILYRWKYLQADMVVEDTYYVGKSFSDTGNDLTIKEETLATSAANPIVSHHYEDQLDTEAKVEALKLPVITAQPERDKQNLEAALDVLDGILPVKLRGHGIYYAPWDQIPRFRGVENCYMDMVSRPLFIHKIIAKFTEMYRTRFEQMEAQGLLDFNIPSLHCTPPYTNELPAQDYDGGKVRFKDIWFRGMAQLFASASPAMQDEFDLQYMRQLMDRCGLSYYGCCEPLDKFIPYLKKVPNMRKIGVSPWANVRSSAEQIEGNYVFARKPNPANVARDFNKAVVEQEIEETIKACMENKCPYEFVLKDISTVSGNPQNLINWNKTVRELIDRYYS
ncbi:hypothetical protein FACS1894109_18330 [Spirochaetia bacterium]|nr:hypothetical protein FACS1894109_18330 [Spirochaetia bacterium]